MLLKTEMRELFPEITSEFKALTSHYYAPRYIVYCPATNHVTTRVLLGSTGDKLCKTMIFSTPFNVEHDTLIYSYYTHHSNGVDHDTIFTLM